MTATAATARVIGLLRATATACQARHRDDRPLSHFGISPLLQRAMKGAFIHVRWLKAPFTEN
ncbi:hypothetical protein UK23_27805 [Lentzea aerocolonigenes]|uniref:Uncharacterized protein n=1 Tax=Lentzea aerocolonigenes TaxID=68170 RepID=A0A0F0GND1_LENAE|nr:hypothetical protein UK23_27805 [Lentzea aerocolonigenes]